MLAAGCPGHRHSPTPAPVTRQRALEEVGDDPLPLCDNAQMFAHMVLGQLGAGHLNGGGANLVELRGGGLRVYHCAAGHAT